MCVCIESCISSKCVHLEPSFCKNEEIWAYLVGTSAIELFFIVYYSLHTLAASVIKKQVNWKLQWHDSACIECMHECMICVYIDINHHLKKVKKWPCSHKPDRHLIFHRNNLEWLSLFIYWNMDICCKIICVCNYTMYW